MRVLSSSDKCNAISQIIAASFEQWHKASRGYFTFTYTSSVSSADFKISFTTGSHGDGPPFDGSRGSLAHSFYPPPNGGSFAATARYDWHIRKLGASPVLYDLGEYTYNTSPSFNFQSAGDYEIILDIYNDGCGSARWFSRTITVNIPSPPYGYYQISPNPSSNYINISAKTNTNNLTVTKNIGNAAVIPRFDKVIIANTSGQVKYQQVINKGVNNLRINTSGLTNGIYYIQLYSAGKVIDKFTLSIKR